MLPSIRSAIELAIINPKYYSGSLTGFIIAGIVGIIATIGVCVHFHKRDQHTGTDIK